MRVVWEASAVLPPRTGVGRYAFELARAMCACGPEVEIHLVWRSLRRSLSADDRQALAGARLHEGRLPPGPWLMRHWAKGQGPEIERLGGEADVVHGVAAVLPRSRARARVLTIHDLHFLREPGSGNALGGRLLARHLPIVAREATRVIVPSEATAHDCEELLGVPRERLRVIAHGGAEVFSAEPTADEWLRHEQELQSASADPLWLFIGGEEPRKNRALAKRACALLAERTGRGQTLFTVPMPAAKEILDENPGLILRYLRRPIDDAMLRCLLRRAQALLVPSFAEGFGLPILEAMASGCPVICSDIPVFREVTGGHARFFDPRDVDSLTAQMTAALADPEGERARAERARTHIAPFTWERTARLTLDVYREAASA